MRWNHLVRVAIAGTAIAMLTGLSAVPVAAVSNPGRTVRWVDGDGHAGGPQRCDGSATAFTAIQDAIDASDDNDLVEICPGTYREQLDVIGKPGLVLNSIKHWQAVVKPPIVVTSTAGFFPAAIYVTSDRTVIRWMRVVIPATGDCDYHMNGIIVDGAHRVSLRSNRLAGGAGDATFCGLADAIIYTNHATGFVGYNLLARFNEAGIFANNGSRLTVHRNSIRFFVPVQCVTATPCVNATSPSGILGQVGIELSDGSSAIVRRNVLKEKASTGETTRSNIGILVSGASATVVSNRIRGLFWGIDFEQGSGSIESNRVRNGQNPGIVLLGSTNVEISGNTVSGGGGDGIDLRSDTSSNNVHDNDFSGNAGIDCVDESVGPANTWTNNFGDDSSPTGLCTAKP